MSSVGRITGGYGPGVNLVREVPGSFENNGEWYQLLEIWGNRELAIDPRNREDRLSAVTERNRVELLMCLRWPIS